MTGSGRITQALLPGKSGDTMVRGAEVSRKVQSFAAVFEKKLQVRTDKTEAVETRPLARSNASAQSTKSEVERSADEKPVERSTRAEQATKKNPAKEKLKEMKALSKQVRETLEAMKDTEIDAEGLMALAATLNGLLDQIRALLEGAAEDAGLTDASALTEAPALQGTDGETAVPLEAQGIAANTDKGHGTVHDKPHWDNRQKPEIQTNPILNALQKVISDQEALLAEDPELKAAFEQVLTALQSLQQMETTAPDRQMGGRLEALLQQLNGIVVKVTDENPAATEAPTEELLEGESVEEVLSVTAAVPTEADPFEQQSNTTEEEVPALMVQGSPATEMQTVEDEAEPETRKTDSRGSISPAHVNQTADKPASQAPIQHPQNAQAFQDTLEAVKEGVQAKGQFQSRIMDQVVESVKMNLQPENGKSEMIMKLKPESLGNVALKVSIEKGVVLAELQVESQQVKQVLESNLQDLKNALQDKGFNVFDLDVSVRKDNQQRQQGEAKGKGVRSAKLETVLDRLEQRMMSLESAQQASTIDYLG